MARKKSAKPPKATLAKILSTVERGFAAAAEDIADIRSTMATKEDIADLRRETKADIAAVRREMATKKDIAGIMEELADRTLRVTPAMAANVTDRPWSLERIGRADFKVGAAQTSLTLFLIPHLNETPHL